MDAKKIAVAIMRKFQTNDPFVIAQHLGVTILWSDMRNTLGFFCQYKRSKFIHLNSNMPEMLQYMVCAHELAHSILHPHINTPYLKMRTLFSTDKIERQANTFAVELLIPDKLLQEHSGVSVHDIAAKLGIPPKLIELKSIK